MQGVIWLDVIHYVILYYSSMFSTEIKAIRCIFDTLSEIEHHHWLGHILSSLCLFCAGMSLLCRRLIKFAFCFDLWFVRYHTGMVNWYVTLKTNIWSGGIYHTQKNTVQKLMYCYELLRGVCSEVIS